MVASNLHVVTHEEEGWAIKREGSANPLSTHTTQRDAINAALDVAQDEETNVIVHRKDGRIKEVKTYYDNSEEPVSTSSPAPAKRVAAVSPLASMGSRVRWGAVMAGFFVTVASSLALTALGVALSLCLSNVMSGENLSIFAGVWVMLTLLASLFVGGIIISRMTVGESEVMEPSVYGVLLWALTFVVLPLLPMTASNVGYGSFYTYSPSSRTTLPPTVEEGLTEEQADTMAATPNLEATMTDWMSGNATEVAWLSFVAILVSLAAAIGGAILGASMDEDHLLAQKRTVRASAA
jgi:hypothetical protein